MQLNEQLLSKRYKDILTLIKTGNCLPREIAHALKANKTNVSTALKYLLDNGYIVRAKFFSTYIYAVDDSMLQKYIKIKNKVYARQMILEKETFNRSLFNCSTF